MASVQDIRRHIRSVHNIEKITKTMEMVASARMQKTSSALLASRPYARLAWSLLKDVSSKTEQELHPLLRSRPECRHCMVVLLTSDRGLCGAFNMNVIHEALNLAGDKEHASFICVGKKGRDYLMRRGYNVIAEFSGLSAPVNFLQIGPIAQIVIKEYTSGNVDEVSVVFGDYVSHLVQKPTVLKLLPLQKVSSRDEGPEAAAGEYIYEPTAQEVVSHLVPRIIEYQVYASILESQTSEFAARMIAMKNATDNAQQLIKYLTLTYNKARQEGITKELTELSSSKLVIEEQ
jgi:F-type H+-transporting ATPase subunit gamma